MTEAPVTEEAVVVETPDDAPVEMDGQSWPITLTSGKRLYALPWAGAHILDTAKAFRSSVWVKRKRAKKTADRARARNRR